MIEIKVPIEVHIGLFLRLYGHALNFMSDMAEMNTLIHSLERTIRRGSEKKCIVHCPLQDGVAQHFAALVIDDFFEELVSPDAPVYQYQCYMLDLLMSDIFDAWEYADFRGSVDEKMGEQVGLFLHEIHNESDHDKLTDLLINDGVP